MNMGTMGLATVGEGGTRIHTDTRAFASCILFGYCYVNWTSVSLVLFDFFPHLYNRVLKLVISNYLYLYLIDNVKAISAC